MILIKGGGRVGNQIFQYAFLKTLFPEKNRIYAFHFEELVKLFDLEDEITLLPKNRLTISSKIINPFLKLIGKSGLVNYYEQVFEKGEYLDKFIEKKGVFKNINIINFGYFQSEKFFNEFIKDKLKIKDVYMQKAKKIVSKFQNKDLVFVHIRRGDYVRLNATLPLSYYFNAIEKFNKKLENPFFVFLSDDMEFVKENFKLKNAYYSDNDMYVDFALMTLCEYGIMSNSTFSYWGGYLMKKRKEVVYPKYWLGFRKKKCLPVGIAPSWAQVRDVE